MSEKEPESPWIIAVLKKEWPAVKKFLVHLACFAAGAILILFLYQQFVMPGKDSTIVALQQEKEKLNSDLQREDRENDKLRSEVASYQASHDEKTFPLKKRVQILAKQLTEYADENFAEASKNDYSKRDQRNQEWDSRFAPRLEVTLKQLDEVGLHSEKIESIKSQLFYLNAWQSVLQIKDIASELNKLSDGLPESDSP